LSIFSSWTFVYTPYMLRSKSASSAWAEQKNQIAQLNSGNVITFQGVFRLRGFAQYDMFMENCQLISF